MLLIQIDDGPDIVVLLGLRQLHHQMMFFLLDGFIHFAVRMKYLSELFIHAVGCRSAEQGGDFLLPLLSGSKRFFFNLVNERVSVICKFFVFIGGRIGERFLGFGFEFMRLTD
ncbi:hypothetical protein D9980_24325 [Serratia sp. 3ACOL1]|nr:hypothetical protein D9980_24325 [Serratia sp. 3ACOL1]